MLVKLDDENQFKNLISKGVVLVDFFATWCGPCRMLGPELEKLAELDPEVLVLKVDCDDFPEIAGEFNVNSIPCLFLFKDGQLVTSKLGFQNLKMLQNFVAQAK